MGAFNIHIKGLDSLIANTNKAGDDLPGLLLQTMKKATTQIKNDARKIRPGSFKNQTGNLRRSIDRRVFSAARGIVFVGEKYGKYVEFGTRPHIIRPKSAKMLAFKVNGQMVFARQVRHPGSKPYPYMEPAFKENKDKVLKEYARVAQVMVERMAR